MTDAELCRRNGWMPGTIITAMVDEDMDLPEELQDVIPAFVGILVLRITAIGEDDVMSRPIMLNGAPLEEEECMFKLTSYDWQEIAPVGYGSRRLAS